MSEGTGLESLGEGEEEEEVEVVEVDEEELKEEWAARGLDPAAFDPLVLLEMWEAEDAEVNKDARLPRFDPLTHRPHTLKLVY